MKYFSFFREVFAKLCWRLEVRSEMLERDTAGTG